jgi:isoquinoline 1-oxidoreductase beta subunit
MGKLRTIGRRAFLIGSAAVVGGVAFGVYAARKPYDNPLLAEAAEGEATFNPWVKIDAEKVTLIVPHADIGQGAVHMQAVLIAEELDIEPGQYETDFGRPSPAYYNTAFAEEGAPFMSRDESGMADTARTFMGYLVKMMGIQGTGGSTSVADSFNKLREAGAVARETLKLAASLETGVPVAQLKTANAAVILPDGTQMKYTELAARAATVKPVTDVVLRDKSEWRLIGTEMQRQDVLAKSTGVQNYGIDLDMDGMVHAAVRFNPRQLGPINGYDATAAEGMRGVKAVLPVTNGFAVVADNTWRAFQAVNAIEADWGAASYPAEQTDHWKVLSDSFTEERLDDEWRHDGDVPAALNAGEATVRAEYRAPYVAHAPLEPLNALVVATDERIDLWLGHQMPRTVEDYVAKITGMDVENIHFHNQYSGGSFGHRLEFENVRYATEIAMKMKGTPVKLTFTREEDFAHDFPRQIAMGRGEAIVTGNTIETLDLSICSPSPINSQMPRAGITLPPGPDSQIVSGAWNMPYKIDNLRVRGFRAPELAPISSWRSVGASHAGFFGESFVDEAILAAGLDPMEGRLALCDYDIARKCLEAVAEMSNWGSELGPNRGRGVAFVSSFGTPTAEVVEVTMTEDGIKIDKVFVAADVGRVVDPITFDNQVKGGVIWGLGHAMNSEITYADGMAEQSNYHDAEGMRLYQTPEITVVGLENQTKVRGIGEPPVPPAAPALANAIFAATGQRLREMPFNKFIDFV